MTTNEALLIMRDYDDFSCAKQEEARRFMVVVAKKYQKEMEYKRIRQHSSVRI
jgi:hypothetical protein